MEVYGHLKHLLFSVSSVVHIGGVYGYGWDYMVVGHSLHLSRSSVIHMVGVLDIDHTIPISLLPQEDFVRLYQKIVRLEMRLNDLPHGTLFLHDWIDMVCGY